MMRNKSKNTKEYLNNMSIRVALFAVVLLSLVLIFTLGASPYNIEFREGDIAVRDIFAPFDFTYYGGVDKEATEILREKAVNEVKLVYDFNDEARQSVSEYMNNLFTTLGSLKKEDIPNEEKLARLKQNFHNIQKPVFLILLSEEDLDKVKSSVNEIVEKVESYPIISTLEKKTLEEEKYDDVILRDLKKKSETAVPISGIVALDEVGKDAVSDLIHSYLKDDHKLGKVISELLNNVIVPNINKNIEEFLRRRDEAKAGVEDVLKERDVKKNEIVIGKGERVEKRHILQFKKIASERASKARKVASPLSVAVIILLLLTVTSLSLKKYEQNVYYNNSSLALISIIVITFFIGARLITDSSLSNYFIPISSASILIAILINKDVAFLVTVMLSIGCGIMVGNKLEMMIICLVGGAMAVYAVHGLRKRSKLLKVGFLVGCVNFITIANFGILTGLNADILFMEAGKGFLNGIASSFIVMGLLPVLEYLFKVTTDITLLELSDLNHPLLKSLTLKAPGTYHHSLQVGNLAETACDAIGANSLLARVGAYYHDIGKMEKPEYFSENAGHNVSHHDKLSPSMSALVITNHVKDGVDLARKYKLNQSIIDFIQQHHGNTLIYYFYQKALEKMADETQIKDEEFRYPGPKPQTKEAAIVLLADAVEASSRTLSNPTPARIEGLVKKMINNKFIDGQLDECDLTLKDLNKIANSFVRILTGVFHSRVEYPQTGEKQSVQDKDKAPKRKFNFKR